MLHLTAQHGKDGRQTPLPFDDDDSASDRAHSPDPQLLPASCSPSVQPGEKCRRSDDSDSEIEIATVHKALKINDKSGRPKARDYDDVVKEVILQAATIYRCLLSTNNGFPELAAETELVKLAWDNANKKSKMRSLELTPDIAKIVSHFHFCHFLQQLPQIPQSLVFIRSRLVDRKLVAKQRRKPNYSSKLCMASRVAVARRRLPQIESLPRN
jgi:hypothetical protein